MDLDGVLSCVLRSTTEMERIQGLDEQEFQSVIDVLGRVSTHFDSVFTVLLFVDTLYPST